jgi:hypothetical protein
VADADRLIWCRAALSRALEPALGLFLAACFLLPTEAAYSLVFYLAVVPCAVARLAPPPWAKSAALWAGSAMILWSALSLCWGEDAGGRTGRFAVGSAATLVFWLATYDVLANHGTRERLQTLLIVLGAASAAVAVAHFAVWPPAVDPGDTPRLQGWGITRHPVLGGAVYGVVMLTALARAVRGSAWRVASLAAAFVAALALLLTKSRGPEMAALGAAMALCAASRWRRWILPGVACAALLGLLLLSGTIRFGDSGHIGVWRATLHAIGARPLFGHGLAADLPESLGADRRFPHDLYLSLLFYSGGVGLALFAVWAGLLARRLRLTWAAPDAPWAMALLLNAALAGLTDFGQITKGPGPLWLILWLPAALAATAQVRPDRQDRPAAGAVRPGC